MSLHHVSVQLADHSIFDGAFTFMKERFTEEMKRMDEEMTKFSKNLVKLYGQTTTVQTGKVDQAAWDVITRSPLVEGDGDEKTLNLQFDVSQFEPTEVNVSIINDMLFVSASHEEKTDDSVLHNEYHREFRLPTGTDPDAVESILSKEGILTVRAPLNLDIDNISAQESDEFID